jgi:hypothetical protein
MNERGISEDLEGSGCGAGMFLEGLRTSNNISKIEQVVIRMEV